VKKRLQEAGLNGRFARNKPKLTKKQRMARLEWAKKYRSWSKSDWEVLWSDESPFTLFIKGGKVFVRRREWETYAPCCMQPTVKFGGGHINVGASVLKAWSLYTKSMYYDRSHVS
jgi:hypothetical protein